MSKIFFTMDYVAVIPTFKEVVQHKHTFLHMFFLGATDDRNCDRILIVDGKVQHQMPALKECRLCLLIDPTSMLAQHLRTDYLLGQQIAIYYLQEYKVIVTEDLNQEALNHIIEDVLQKMRLRLIKISKEDHRITTLVSQIRQYQCIEKSISALAKEIYLSEGRLSHMFKQETGVSLKSYLNLIQMEYAYQLVLHGTSIVDAALEAGFSSAAHLAAICKKQTGISITGVTR